MFLAAIKNSWALLIGIALLMLGNGMQGTLISLRASLEGFSTNLIGLIMTAYFAGFLLGSVLVPKMVGTVGHIRVFAALASLASCAVLLHTVFLSPLTWGMFRFVTGFSYAGLYVVAESWLNHSATNETRGRLLSIYMIIVLGGSGGGQLLLNVADPTGSDLFILVSVLVSIAIIPISLSVARAPELEPPEPTSIAMLFKASPLGVVGAFAVGIAHSAMLAMGAIYAREIGLPVDKLSLFIAVWLFGGLLLQWPIGRLSDYFDRRQVILFVTMFAALFAVLGGLFGSDSYTSLIIFTTFLGGMSLPLYALFIAHTNDHLAHKQIVSASGTLVLVGGFGLTLGPTFTAQAMNVLGPNGLFWCIAGVHLGIGLYAIYRMFRRDPVPLAKQRSYQQVTMRTSPVAQEIAMKTVQDSRDRDLAKMSGK